MAVGGVRVMAPMGRAPLTNDGADGRLFLIGDKPDSAVLFLVKADQPRRVGLRFAVALKEQLSASRSLYDHRQVKS